MASGHSLLFLDGDDIPSEDWLERMTDAAPRFDIIGGQVEMSALNPRKYWSQEMTLREVVSPSFPCLWVLSANIGCWREVFDAVGGWPLDFVTAEDAPLCFSAQMMGFTVGAADKCPSAKPSSNRPRAAMRTHYNYG